MIACLNCGNTEFQNFVFIENGYLCKCCSGNDSTKVVELDELISETIILLNQKGFETIHSCEGHFTGKRNTQFSGNLGYLTILDDGNVLDDLKSIPDTIDNFNIMVEVTNGPKSVLDWQMVTKVVIRFDYISEDKILNNYDFIIKKANFFEKLVNIILPIERGKN